MQEQEFESQPPIFYLFGGPWARPYLSSRFHACFRELEVENISYYPQGVEREYIYIYITIIVVRSSTWIKWTSQTFKRFNGSRQGWNDAMFWSGTKTALRAVTSV